jgi:hypothetical protein
VCLVPAIDASARAGTDATVDASAIRSAQLFARGSEWAVVEPRRAEEEQAEIRAHFSAVQRVLAHNASASLDVAVFRFQQAFRVSLSPERREELRSRLAERRGMQVARLLGYAQTGRFPLNRHYAREARPIFVDAQGTHCAVGYLMALDGWEREVMNIARARPNVLVREVNSGPLVEWVLTSGLIQEEAALIQPSYFAPPPSDVVVFGNLVVPGASLERNGFRYSNFGLSSSSSGGAPAPPAQNFVVAYGWSPINTVEPSIACGFYTPTCVPRPDALWFGVNPQAFSQQNPFYLLTFPGQSIQVDIDYDVEAMLPGLQIRGTESFALPAYGGFTNAGFSHSSVGQASLVSGLDGAAAGLLQVQLTNQLGDDASALFGTPTTHAHMHHRMQIANGAAFTSFDSVILSNVPLPGSAVLLGIPLALMGGFRRWSSRQAGRSGR